MRRVTHEAFHTRATQKYRSLQQNEAASLALQLIRDPENWMKHVNRYDEVLGLSLSIR